MKFFFQHDQMDCGPACLAMITSHYGKYYSLEYLRNHAYLTREGVSVRGISEAAQNVGMDTFSGKLAIEKLEASPELLPCILHWNQNHFVVLKKIQRDLFSGKKRFHVLDPGYGPIKISRSQFEHHWISNEQSGIALFLSPGKQFYQKEIPQRKRIRLRYILGYLQPYKIELFQLFLGLFGGSILTLFFPFLTQALIDQGIGDQSFKIIYIILIAQLFLFLGGAIIEIIRNWVTLYIGARVNLTILSAFLKKLMALPIRFFDTKMIGDFTQRIGDHARIEKFLTSQSLLTLFSFLNVSVFFVVLAYYDLKILAVYSGLTVLAVSWAIFFMKKRKLLDYQSFQKKAENQESIFQLINGMQEIKLNNFQNYQREAWEHIQVKLFKVNQKILRLDQLQGTGFNLINHLKNILVTFIAANEVLAGNISLGAMLSISYIIGQMNSPISQIINFVRGLQDAKISFSRLEEIHEYENEHSAHQAPVSKKTIQASSNGILRGICLENVSFQYEGPTSPYVLNNISLFIPKGKTTAIVGSSGSGKTTLMKLLLCFYPAQNGSITIDNKPLKDIIPESWRKHCGTVMQDGYIFSDTLERNIATSDQHIDPTKLARAIQVANLASFIEKLPLGLQTKLGAAGNGISGGQKQRILIARAVYKNPEFLFFDEATSSLDAENERIIMDNLQEFLQGKTSVIIAHRLSTVKHADHIIVLEKGQIIECGKHQNLVKNKGRYYNLIKNQLELGS